MPAAAEVPNPIVNSPYDEPDKRWKNAVNADNKHGKWAYEMIDDVGKLDACIQRVYETAG